MVGEDCSLYPNCSSLCVIYGYLLSKKTLSVALVVCATDMFFKIKVLDFLVKME